MYVVRKVFGLKYYYHRNNCFHEKRIVTLNNPMSNVNVETSRNFNMIVNSI